MAIAYGSVSGIQSLQSYTNQITVSGTNVAGVVWVLGDLSSGSNGITACSWNGTNCPKIADIAIPGDRWIMAFGGVGVTNGGNVTFTGGSFWASFQSYYTGVDQTTPFDASNSGTISTNNSLTIGVSVPSGSGHWVAMGAAEDAGNKTWTTSTGGSLRVASSNGTGMGCIIDSNGAVTQNATYTTTITTTGTPTQGGIAFSIKPSGGATVVNSGFFFACSR